MKKIYTLLVVVLVAVGAMAQDEISVWNGKCTMWTRGEGTQESPILIESAENLAFLSYMCAHGFASAGTYFELTTDIDLNGSEALPWNPIGTMGYYDYQSGCKIVNTTYNAFKGHFDGGGHRIYNLYSETGGLFGTVYGRNDYYAVVENVMVMSGMATGGAIADNISNAKVIRCGNKADVVCEDGNAGGIVGEAGQGCVIKECFNEGDVSGKVVGGIAAFPRKSTIMNCYNVGGVEGTETAAGCIGQSVTNEIQNCYNVGNVACSGSYIGALVGRTDGNDNVNNSYYLNTCGAMGDGTPKNADEMREESFVVVLNNETDAWGFDDAFENQGFPILKSNPTEVGEIAEIELHIYPNPANDVLMVECGDATAIAVYDVLGQCVRQLTVSNATTKLDVADLESGVYILSVSGSNRPALVTRFIVSR